MGFWVLGFFVVLVHRLRCKPIRLLMVAPSLIVCSSWEKLTVLLTRWEQRSLSGQERSAFVISYLLGLCLGKSEVDLRVLKVSRTRQGWLLHGSCWTLQANHGFWGARSRNCANFFSPVSACCRSMGSRVM